MKPTPQPSNPPQPPEEQALDLLSRWPAFATRDFWSADDQRSCYGTGYNGWGVQTNQKFMSAMAVLATDDAFDAGRVSRSRDEILDWALRSLRFSLATHHTGEINLADGTRWGRTWISGLGIERMMHGVERLEPHLTDADRAALRRVLIDEANHQLTEEVKGGPWGDSGRNKPESNLWNGAICVRAATLVPDDPNAAAWTDKAHDWFVNGISVAADAADSTTLYGGKPVCARHVGANFFPHYSLDHHAYLNVGYMVICLSNVAMLHYALPDGHGFPSLYHHARDLWALVKRLVFADGRLCRIGGDTRQRYCYCQDYLLPVLVMAAGVWHDPHAMDLLNGQLRLIEQEMDANADGGFLSRRLDHIFRLSPHYATRLESDKAVALSMARTWLTPQTEVATATDAGFEAAVSGGWIEPEHGAVFHRSPTRMASFAWRAAEGPMGLCLPPGDGHLAEWMANLAGEIRLLGAEGKLTRVERRELASFDGGFLTYGRMSASPKRALQEGWSSQEDWVWHDLVVAALPDGHTLARLEFARLIDRRTWLDGLLGVKLEIPNDLFNGDRRVYRGEFGRKTIRAHQGNPETVPLSSPWINVDQRLGVVGLYGADEWTLVRRGRRIGGYAGSILTDALCYPAQARLTAVAGPATLLDTGTLILASVKTEATRRAQSENATARLPAPDECRAVRITGRDRRTYALAANFGASPQSMPLDGAWRDLTSGEIVSTPLRLEAGQARVLIRA